MYYVFQDNNYISFVAGTYTGIPTLVILKVFYFQWSIILIFYLMNCCNICIFSDCIAILLRAVLELHVHVILFGI